MNDRVTDPATGLMVLFEDEWLIAIDKPAGLLSQPGRTVSDSVSQRVRDGRPAASGSLMMHRLDMDTSGVILLAKSAAAHAHLQQQFEKRVVHKRYRALLERPVRSAGGQLCLPLRLDVERRPYQIVCREHGRHALSVWRRAGEDPHEVLLLPRTGRTHQLRVHAADPAGLGNPIRGDRLYGREAERLHLHAERLVVRHPQDGRTLVLTSPCPFRAGAGAQSG